MFAQIEQKWRYIIKQGKCAKNHPDEPSGTEFKTRELLLSRKEQEAWSPLGDRGNIHSRIHLIKWKGEKYFLKCCVFKIQN